MIRTERAHLNVVARTHPGMTGKNNEDRYAVSAYQVSESNATPALVAVLSDGIGGHRGGEVAAEMAVEGISRRLAETNAEQPIQTLRDAILHTSQDIYAQAQRDPNLYGMGATCAVVWVVGSRLYTTAIGDSRIYLMRRGHIQQVTTDHTWIQEALDQGALTDEEARGHPNQHVIRRFLGSPTPPEIDTRLRLDNRDDDEHAAANQGAPLFPGDRLLLCSDGLTDLVSAEEILQAFSAQTQEEAVDGLVALACERGGHDNITVIAAEVPAQASAAVAGAAGSGRRSRWFVGGCAVALLVLAAAAAAWWGWNRLAGSPTEPTITRTLPAQLATLTTPGATGAGPTPTRPIATPRPTVTRTPPAGQTPAATSGTALPPPGGATAPAPTPGPGGRPTFTPWPTLAQP